MVVRFTNFLDLSLEMSPLEHCDFVPGVDYFTLEIPDVIQGDAIEIKEFFNYKSPLFYDVEVELEEWLKKSELEVKFSRSAVSVCDLSQESARVYYALEAMGKVHDMHLSLLADIGTNAINFADEQELEELLTKYSVDFDEFKTMIYSETVTKRLSEANTMAERYQLTSFPAFVIQGEYWVKADHDDVTNVITYLIELEKMNIHD